MATVVNLINEVFGTAGTEDYPKLVKHIEKGQVDARVSTFLDAWQEWASEWTRSARMP